MADVPALSGVALPGDPAAAGSAARRGYVDAQGIRQASDYDDSATPTEGQAILWVPSAGKWAPRTITPAAIGAAADADVVKLAGTQTVTGVKVFNIPPRVGVGDRVDHPVRRDDARLTDARAPTSHGHVASDVSGVGPAAALVNGHGSRGDRALYGDELSPFQRFLAANTQGTTALTTMYYSAAVAAADDTATRVRLFCRAASAGTGSVSVGVFVGSDPASLTRVATASVASAAVGMIELALSAQVSWTAGQYVVVAVIYTGFSTVPSMAAITGGPPSALLNPTNLLAVVARASTSAMPTALNLTTGGGSSGAILWWSLYAPS